MLRDRIIIFAYLSHRRSWYVASANILGAKLNPEFSQTKQRERHHRITSLPSVYREPLTAFDIEILELPVAKLAASVRTGENQPINILTAYGKKALEAHAETNCLTEILLSSAEAWARNCNRNGPLAGVPVSLKDVRIASIAILNAHLYLQLTFCLDSRDCGMGFIYRVFRLGR